MKLRALALTLLALAALCTVAWLAGSRNASPRVEAQLIQTTRFLGYTNGIVGPVASYFVTNSAKDSIVQQWYVADASAGLFTVTNEERTGIRLYPFGRFCTKGPKSLNETTYLLDVPSFNGFHLQPGRSVTVQVALLPHQGPWRVLLFYERDPGSISLPNTLKGLAAILGARMRGKPDPSPPQPEKYEVYSDWIVQ